jgi:hypothetical protein
VVVRKFVLLMLLAAPAWAQFTTVTGTVTDPNGLPYANGTISATLVISGSPTLGGFPYTPPTQPTGLSTAGSFTMRLADNTQLSPGGSTWTFTVSCAAGCVPVAGGKGPITFTVTGITISGASQSITATLTAAALALSSSSGGGSGISSFTVATLPAAPATGTLAQVTDGAGAGDCTVGGGTILTLCRWNGVAWVAFTGPASGQVTFGGNTYTGFGSGVNSFPPHISGITAAGNYPPVPATGYGYAALDISPALFTAPPPLVAGTSSRSIMGINSAIATAFPDIFNVFAINGQLTTPSSYAGNQWAWYGMYHESDHNGSGVLHLSYADFGASYNNGNGTCTTCIGGHFESIGNFYGGTNTPITALAVALDVQSGVRASATHTNDYTVHILSPVTGGTFTNGHTGLLIDDQTSGGVLPSAIAFRIGAGGNITSGSVDLGANNINIETTGGGTGLVQINAPTGTYGNHFFTFSSTNGFFITSPCLSAKVFLNADFTSANAAGLQAITGLSCAFPNFATNPNVSFQCNLMYSQATNVAGDQFGVSLSNTLTNFNAWGRVDTNTGPATPYTTGTALAIAASTPTAVVTFQPANTGLNQAQINGTIEINGTTGTFQLYVTNGTAANVIVVKRSSYCQFF